MVGGQVQGETDNRALLEVLSAWSVQGRYDARVAAVIDLLNIEDGDETDVLVRGAVRDPFLLVLGDIAQD